MSAPHENESRSGWRWVRLGAFLIVVSSVSVWWEVRKVSANLAERSLSFGRQLDKLSELSARTTTIELNGARMALTTTVRHESIGVLLDRFAAVCARDSGGVSEQLDELSASGASVPDALKRGAFGVYRSEREDLEGTAACFARQQRGGLMETLRRIDELLETGDFAALGQLRYMFAKKTFGGQSHVIAVSSLGSLPLDRMFPAHGDAPGPDLVDAVRPPRARRLLSVRVDGSSLQTAMYETSLAPEPAVRAFEPALKARGFALGDLASVEASLVASTRVFLRGDQTILVVAAPRGEGQTAVSTFRLQGGGFRTADAHTGVVQP
jgi:hypothetical protein